MLEPLSLLAAGGECNSETLDVLFGKRDPSAVVLPNQPFGRRCLCMVYCLATCIDLPLFRKSLITIFQ